MLASLLLGAILALSFACRPENLDEDGSSGDSSSTTANDTQSNEEPEAKPDIVRNSEVDSPPQEPSSAVVERISFDDLNIGMQVDAKFRKIMLNYNDGRVKRLFGERVNVAGYMNPTDTMTDVKEFILLRNLECKFGPGGQADHLVHILLQGDVTTSFTDKVVYVEGELVLNEFPVDAPSTWSIYDLKATKVSTRAPPRSR